jgi:hypothetical protein
MQIKSKVLLSIFLLSFCAITFYSISDYYSQKKVFMENLDEKLFDATQFLKAIIGEDYHDRLTKDSFSHEEYDKIIVKRNNNLCKKLGFQCLWSCKKIGDDLVFTSSTSPGFDESKHDHAKFFDVHSDPHAFDKVFETMQPVYSLFRNEWGHGRQLLVPLLSKDKKIMTGIMVGFGSIQFSAKEQLFI